MLRSSWSLIPIPVWWSSPRTSPAPSAPIQSRAPPTTACWKVANGSMCAPLRAQKGRDADTADREGTRHAAEIGVGGEPRCARKDQELMADGRWVVQPSAQTTDRGDIYGH